MVNLTVAGLIVVRRARRLGQQPGDSGDAPAAAPAPFRWNLLAATARLIREAVEWPVPFRAMLGSPGSGLVGALYLAQFPSLCAVRAAAARNRRHLFSPSSRSGSAPGRCCATGCCAARISARTVPWGMLGLALFSIDLWLPARPPVGGTRADPVSAFLAQPAGWRILVDLFGIAVSGRRLYRAALRAVADRERPAPARPARSAPTT